MSTLDAFKGKGEPPPLVAGYVADVDGIDVLVILPSFDLSHQWGPLAGVPAGVELTRGMAVLVGFDETGEPWCVSVDTTGTRDG